MAPSSGKASRIQLASAAAVVPHPDKAGRQYERPPHCGGEDAYFIEDAIGVVGVADGVGGWSSKGVDPGLFSRELMAFAAEAVVKFEKRDPLDVLRAAHAKTRALGSSTALIVALETVPQTDSGLIHAANLGDSGFLIVRRRKVIAQSEAQQHSFNFPFQLGAPGTFASRNKPGDAEIFKIPVEAGDMLVLGTDGLFDNLYSDEILTALDAVAAEKTPQGLNRWASPSEFAKAAAEALAWEAAMKALDTERQSPFAQEAAKAGHRFRGGKVDDITVVVAMVVVTNSTSQVMPPLRSKL